MRWRHHRPESPVRHCRRCHIKFEIVIDLAHRKRDADGWQFDHPVQSSDLLRSQVEVAMRATTVHVDEWLALFDQDIMRNRWCGVVIGQLDGSVSPLGFLGQDLEYHLGFRSDEVLVASRAAIKDHIGIAAPPVAGSDQHVRWKRPAARPTQLGRDGRDQVRLDDIMSLGSACHADRFAIHEFVLQFLAALPVQDTVRKSAAAD